MGGAYASELYFMADSFALTELTESMFIVDAYMSTLAKLN